MLKKFHELFLSIFLVVCSISIISTAAFAKTFIDAYRIDPNGRTYDIYRTESESNNISASINGVDTHIPWKMIKKIIVIDGRYRKYAIVLKDNRTFKDVFISNGIDLFNEYSAIDPVSGKMKKQYIGFLLNGSIVELGTVSGGIRKDSQGNIWPAQYLHSPITGESLGNIQKKSSNN